MTMHRTLRKLSDLYEFNRRIQAYVLKEKEHPEKLAKEPSSVPNTSDGVEELDS